MGRRQRRGVIDAVAHHDRGLARFIQSVDPRDLVLGFQPRLIPIKTERMGRCGDRRFAIARQKLDGQALGFQARDGLGRVRPQTI